MVDSAAVRVVVALPHRLQQRMLDRLDVIARSPDRYSEFHTTDRIGRSVEGHIFENYAIWDWIDFPMREVKVIKIGPADRRP